MNRAVTLRRTMWSLIAAGALGVFGKLAEAARFKVAP
jgi:hypothetical protein